MVQNFKKASHTFVTQHASCLSLGWLMAEPHANSDNAYACLLFTRCHRGLLTPSVDSRWESWATGAVPLATIPVCRTRGSPLARLWRTLTTPCHDAPVASDPGHVFPPLPATSPLPSPCPSRWARHAQSRVAGCNRLKMTWSLWYGSLAATG